MYYCLMHPCLSVYDLSECIELIRENVCTTFFRGCAECRRGYGNGWTKGSYRSEFKCGLCISLRCMEKSIILSICMNVRGDELMLSKNTHVWVIPHGFCGLVDVWFPSYFNLFFISMIFLSYHLSSMTTSWIFTKCSCCFCFSCISGFM